MTNSIRARFGFSLIANLSKAAVTFGTGIIVARGLGPNQFGTMMFLLGTFTAVRGLLDMSSSTAFFTFLSQRQRSRNFVFWYFAWLVLQFLLPLLGVGLLFPNSWIELVWRGEQRQLVILAFLAAYMQSVLWTTMLQMGESQRLTRLVQGVAVAVALVHFILIQLVWWADRLTIEAVFGLIIVEWLIAVLMVVKQLPFDQLPENSETTRSIVIEFWNYCKPLVLYSWLGFAYEFSDRWLLQKYAGSVEQAYYSVAFQFAAIAAIATSSIMNIFWKEIAEAQHQNNHERVELLYKKVSRGLFFVSATGAGFFAPWAEEILRITLGVAYIGGANTLMLMFYYPLHQTMGQIGGTMAYATGQVKVHVKIGIAFMMSSIVVSYFVLATAETFLPGLGLGSLGLASKMVVMQIISVNALAYCLSRNLNIRFDWVFQFVTTAVCSGSGFASYTLSHVILSNETSLARLLLAGFVHIILLIIILFSLPSLLGMRRQELMSFVVVKR